MLPQPIDVTPSAYSFPLLIKHLLHRPLAVAPDQEIVYRDQVRYTYRDLMARIGKLASALARLGVSPGDTVAVMDWDSHRYLECFFAIPMMGAVLETINVRLSPEQVLYTLNHAQARVLLVHQDFLPLLSAVRDKLTSVKTFVLIREGEKVDVEGFAGEYEGLSADASVHYDFPDFDENARATTFYTTGTTGLPKGVYFSHRQLVLHTLAAASGLAMPKAQGRFHAEDVYMPITPMFHVHAWGVPYVATLMGVKQVYPGRYLPDVLLRLIAKEGVTFSHCVPTILSMLLTHPSTQEVSLANWKVVIGGSALPRALAEAALAKGVDVFAGYGMSETCPLLTLAQISSAELEAPDAVALRIRAGRPVPLVDLRTVDFEMRDTPRDGKSPGEIVVRAPWLTQGYLYDAQASETLWGGGYLHTNDIGCLDSKGFVQVTDRIKDVIKTGGEWVSSLYLEDLISRYPGVAEVAVIGVPDPKWGERPLPFVVVKPGATVDRDGIRAHVEVFVEKGEVCRYAVPDQIRFVDALPKTSVGKLDKKALRAKASEG